MQDGTNVEKSAQNKDAPKRFTCLCRPIEHANLPLSKFYTTRSGMYAELGHLPICKECFEAKLGEYTAQLHHPHLAMRRMCMLFDLYYSTELFDKSNGSTGLYFRKLNMIQYRDKNFDNAIAEGNVESGVGAIAQEKDIVTEDDYSGVDPELVDRWGRGLEPIDYDNLESHYNFLKSANPNCDSNQEIFIMDLCYTKMQQNRAIREGRSDDFIKLTDSYRKTFTQAGLKTVRDSSNDEEFRMGVTIETIEKYTPAEYYKNKKKFKDFDGIGEYFAQKLVRPLKNLQFGTHDRDPVDYVHDDEEDGGVND